MNTETVTKLEDIACRMAQELQEFVDAAYECSPQPGAGIEGTRALLDEWERIWRELRAAGPADGAVPMLLREQAS